MVDIPTLDIEDYDPDLNEEEEAVEDKSGGALTLCYRRCRSRRRPYGKSVL